MILDETSIEKSFELLSKSPLADEKGIFQHWVQEQTGSLEQFPKSMSEPLHRALFKSGIQGLYTHQIASFNLLQPCMIQEIPKTKESVLISSGTASGKSLCYWLPALETLLRDPRNRILVLTPTKALAQDQFRKLKTFIEQEPDLMACLDPAIYDGDTPQSKRKYIRENANLIFTNPDMLHASMLPGSGAWGDFFRKLRLIVIDEAHSYRGVFGSQVSLVLSRLTRMCRKWGAIPSHLLLTATIDNPTELGEKLLRTQVTVLQGQGRKGAALWVIWNLFESRKIRSPLTEKQKKFETQPSLYSESVSLALFFGSKGHRVLCFTQSRLQCELLGRYLEEYQQQNYGEQRLKIATYRSGYNPKERRALEESFSSGKINILVSTNALELGIDVGDLDVVLQYGFPGSHSSFFQQAGRAGRKGKTGCCILLPSFQPLDQYIARSPDFLWKGRPECAYLDPDNVHFLEPHLLCAGCEYPLSPADSEHFGPNYLSTLNSMVNKGLVKELKGKWFYHGKDSPAGKIGLRGLGDKRYLLMDIENMDHPLGEVDEEQMRKGIFPDAIYMHQGQTWQVLQVDSDLFQIFLKKVDSDYFTLPVQFSRLLLGKEIQNQVFDTLECKLSEVTHYSYLHRLKRIAFHTGMIRGFIPVERELPPLETLGAIFYPAEQIAVEKFGPTLQALVGLRNLISEAIPGWLQADPGDFMVVLDTGIAHSPALVILDTWPGGTGLAVKCLMHCSSLFTLCAQMLESCPCTGGCPACVGVEAYELSKEQRYLPNKELTKKWLSA